MFVIFALIQAIVWSFPAGAVADTKNTAKNMSSSIHFEDVLIPSPSPVHADSYILQDADSLEVLAEKDSEKTLHPASLTKMMTAYIVEAQMHQGTISKDDVATVSKKAWSLRGSTMFLNAGDKVSVGDLLKGVVIVSGNDASVVLAEYLAGSESAFAQMMNNMARQLGMFKTNFVNSSGWPAKEHYSTAQDLAILSRHIIYDYPENYDIYSIKYFTYGVDRKTGSPLRQSNRNRLLWSNQYVDGIKTGHTDASGYHLAVTAKQKSRRLIVVILGAASEKQRADDSQMLLTHGFRFFENVEIDKGRSSLLTARVWGGDREEVDVEVADRLVITVPRGTGKQLRKELILHGTLVAPVTAGQRIGTLVVQRKGIVIREVPLLSRQSVNKGGFIKIVWDNVKLFFSRLLSKELKKSNLTQSNVVDLNSG